MHSFMLPPADTFDALTRAARERILILDGAMGTMIQTLGLDEDAFRGHGGHSCAIHSDHPQQGNNDLLILTQPQAVEDIHYAFAMAGADIVETNTFSSTTIAQADYAMEDRVHALNAEGARIARRAMDRATAQDGKPRWVAGAVGPTNRTASMSPDVNDPGYRAVTFDDLRRAYGQQIRGLIDGGADLILIETIFDTLNAKAAIFAISPSSTAGCCRLAGGSTSARRAASSPRASAARRSGSTTGRSAATSRRGSSRTSHDTCPGHARRMVGRPEVRLHVRATA